jgi:hypothetical protein
MILPAYTLIRRKWLGVLGALLFAGIAVSSVLVILYYVRHTPCDCWYEGLSFAIDLKEYLLALGPIVPLSLLAIPVVRKKPRLLLFVIWAVSAIVMVPVSKRLLDVPWAVLREIPLSNVRFLQMAPWIPLGLLTAHGLWWFKKHVPRPVFVITLAVLAFLTFIGYPSSLQAQVREASVVNNFETPPTDWHRAMTYIEEEKLGPTMALQHASVYIPAFTGETVYVGRQFISQFFEAKAQAAYLFFAGMDACEAYNLVSVNDVRSVFYGFDEGNAGVLTYPFLTEEKRFGETIVYRVLDTRQQGCEL